MSTRYAKRLWPLPNTRYRELYLSAADNTLGLDKPARAATLTYDALAGASVSFDHRSITGHMRLELWVSTDRGDDMDLFVAIKKLDAAGDEVYFEGRENDPRGPVANGWLRVSHRALDPQRSRPFQPVLTHESVQLISPGQIVPVEIEILMFVVAMNGLFHANHRVDMLRLIGSGHPIPRGRCARKCMPHALQVSRAARSASTATMACRSARRSASGFRHSRASICRCWPTLRPASYTPPCSRSTHS